MRTRSRCRRASPSVTATTKAFRANAPVKSRSCCNRRSALPADAISYEWAGANQPIADNATAAGRAANRRVAVEIWYDEFKDATGTEEFVVKNDIQQVKVCRVETVCKLRYIEGHERRARVQNLVAPLHYDDASLQLSPTFVAQVAADARESARQTARRRQVHRLHRQFTAGRARSAHLRRSRNALEGARAPRRRCDSGATGAAGRGGGQ